MKYKDFYDWIYGHEDGLVGMRIEYFYEDIARDIHNPTKLSKTIFEWLKASFEESREPDK